MTGREKFNQTFTEMSNVKLYPYQKLFLNAIHSTG